MINTDNTQLLIIDIQEKLINATFNKDNLIKKSEIIAKAANILNLPTCITEQYPQGLGKTIENISKNLTEHVKYFEKVDFSALNNPELVDYLKKQNRKNIIICGIETHICVYQTVKALLQNNYNVTVLKDICGSRAEDEYISALDCMKSLGAETKTCEMVLFELLKSARNPLFKSIQALIK